MLRSHVITHFRAFCFVFHNIPTSLSIPLQPFGLPVVSCKPHIKFCAFLKDMLAPLFLSMSSPLSSVWPSSSRSPLPLLQVAGFLPCFFVMWYKWPYITFQLPVTFSCLCLWIANSWRAWAKKVTVMGGETRHWTAEFTESRATVIILVQNHIVTWNTRFVLK